MARQAPKKIAKKRYMLAHFLAELEALIAKREKVDRVTPYYMAIKLFHVAPQQYDRWRNVEAGQKSIPCTALTAGRKNSGLSWEAWGKLWDKHLEK